VLPDDVKELAYATLGHRIIIAPAARVKNATAKEVVEQTLERIPVPGARVSR
jgi:MoxR-like ATPase